MDTGLKSTVATGSSLHFTTLWSNFSQQRSELIDQRMPYCHHFRVSCSHLSTSKQIKRLFIFFCQIFNILGIENVLMKSHLKAINVYCQVRLFVKLLCMHIYMYTSHSIICMHGTDSSYESGYCNIEISVRHKLFYSIAERQAAA